MHQVWFYFKVSSDKLKIHPINTSTTTKRVLANKLIVNREWSHKKIQLKRGKKKREMGRKKRYTKIENNQDDRFKTICLNVNDLTKTIP